MNFELVETSDALNRAAQEWNKEKELGLDIECENNLHHYGTSIAIVQISSKDKNWVVDLVKIKEATPLVKMLENPNILKVFHDVSFDYRILEQELGCRPKNVFDTAIASALLGWEEMGLGPLLEKHFNVKKEKKYQKADWTKRPISKDMLSYAIKDTAYSLPLMHLMKNSLEKKGRFDWALEEFKTLETANYHVVNGYYSIKGAGTLNDTELTILKKIYEVREKIAKKLDKPVYFIIRNKDLLDIAKKPPVSISEFRKLKGIHPFCKTKAELFVNAIKEAQNSLILKHPKKKRPKRLNSSETENFDRLNKIRTKIAAKIGIESYLILDRDEMIQLSVGKPISILKKWQQMLLQEELDKLQLNR